MKYREKLGYIALGGFLMLVGMLAAGLTSPSGAFNNAPDAVFGTITCREIKVVDAEGELGAEMRGDEYGKGGVVRVYSKDGKTGASMVVDEHGGRLRVVGEEGKSRAEMGIYGGGYVLVADKDTLTSGASMRIYEHGGAVSVFGGISGASMVVDKDGGVVRVVGEEGISGASMGVNEYGNGEVTTTDKNGKLATLD